MTDALLVLADGETFEGEAVGYVPPAGVTAGEVVFNTSLAGYQEILTDPSYAGQIITFTYPHIGNYGINERDDEARAPHCRGVIVRDLARRPSNWRATDALSGFLRRHRVSAIAGIDTRRLTRHLRTSGAIPGAVGTADAGFYVVAYDFGINRSILDQLVAAGCQVEVVPASTPAADVLAREPDGVFLSNGPGDPSAVDYASKAIRDLLGQVPVFGICLGHQLLATAIGGQTEKLPFGHHGGNHPVRRIETGAVEITSQSHNFAVMAESLSGIAEVTHVNLNDGVCEGMRVLDAPAFSVQYHPEAGPGPHDARYLFALFDDLMEAV